MRECEIPLDLPTANAKGRPQPLLLLGVDDAPSQKHPATLADLDDLRLGRHRVTDIDRAEELERHLRSQERPQTAQMGQQSTQIEETAQSDCSGLNGGALPAVGSDKQFAHPHLGSYDLPLIEFCCQQIAHCFVYFCRTPPLTLGLSSLILPSTLLTRDCVPEEKTVTSEIPRWPVGLLLLLTRWGYLLTA